MRRAVLSALLLAATSWMTVASALSLSGTSLQPRICLHTATACPPSPITVIR